MDAFVWTDRFVTGIESVDARHRGLVERINAFGELSLKGEVAGAEIAALLEELSDYAQSHFAEEESLMTQEKIDLRFFSDHRAQHEQFLSQVTTMKASGGAGANLALFRFLVGWLAFHILGSDQQMARQLSRLAAGESAERAFELEVQPTHHSASVLLEAVDGLMGIVAARNHELVGLNRDLEQRVAARTHELTCANAELVEVVRRLKDTQLQLIQTEKMASIGTLASGIAHEINNPIGFVSSNLATLKDSVTGMLALLAAYADAESELAHPPTRERLASARAAADLPFLAGELPLVLEESRQGLDRVRAIVADLGEFSQVTDSSWQQLDLARNLETTLAILAATPAPGVSFVKDHPEVPRVRCLGAQLNQALLNLLTNAVQAIADCPSGRGTITTRLRAEGDFVWIEIADTGVGMSDETRAHAFEPFFSTRPVGKGLGLGLSVAWATAHRHGGRLELTSELGKGSAVRLWLPVAGPGSTEAPPSFASLFNRRRSGRP